jgi:toxin YoeB
VKLGVAFTPQGWDDYKSWNTEKVMLRRIDRLIEGLRRDPDNPGIGFAERLSHLLAGWLSRRIAEDHRLIYRINGDYIEISQCRGHYL